LKQGVTIEIRGNVSRTPSHWIVGLRITFGLRGDGVLD
jgi:hypothetical protein